MIDRSLVQRLLLASLALLLLMASGSFAIWNSFAIPGGLALGFLLGALPLASWTWIAGRLFAGRGRVLAVLLLSAKLPLYAGILFVTRTLVHPAAVMVGITAVVLVAACGALLGGAAPAKGTA